MIEIDLRRLQTGDQLREMRRLWWVAPVATIDVSLPDWAELHKLGLSMSMEFRPLAFRDALLDIASRARPVRARTRKVLES